MGSKVFSIQHPHAPRSEGHIHLLIPPCLPGWQRVLCTVRVLAVTAQGGSLLSVGNPTPS